MLTVPENFADFYQYPAQPLNEIRRVLTAHLPVRIEGAARISLFAYDNGTFIVHNFRDEPATVTAVFQKKPASLSDIRSGESVELSVRQTPARGAAPASEAGLARIDVPAHSFHAFAYH